MRTYGHMVTTDVAYGIQHQLPEVTWDKLGKGVTVNVNSLL